MKRVIVNGMCFELHEDHAELYSACKGMEKAVIPDEVEGLPVTVLQSAVFWKHVELREVVFPRSLIQIGPNCFWGCSRLEHLRIPEQTAYIHRLAFAHCFGLKTLHISSECSIEWSAFLYCANLTEVRFDRDVRIGDSAFRQCTSLSKILGSEHICEIESGAFVGCSALQELCTQARFVESKALLECDALTRFTCALDCRLDPYCGLKYLANLSYVSGAGLSEYDSILYDREGRMVARYSGSLTGNVELPEGVTQLYDKAFQNTDITRIVLPETVTTLPYKCFRNAANLREVVAPGVTEVADGCFEGCRSLEKVITKPLDKVGERSFEGCTSLREIRLSPECRCIGSQAFYGCSSLHHVEAEGVRAVCWQAFAECSSLDEMPHMPRLARVGDYAFRDCSGLTHLTFPATLVEIEQGAFSGCDGLTSIEFQGNTTGVVHENAFETTIQTKFLTDPDMFYIYDKYKDEYDDEYLSF